MSSQTRTGFSFVFAISVIWQGQLREENVGVEGGGEAVISSVVCTYFNVRVK